MGIRRCSIRAFGFMIHRDERPNLALRSRWATIVGRQRSPLVLPERMKAMPERVVAMMHVPNVRATVDWYTAIGFTVTSTYEEGPEC